MPDKDDQLSRKERQQENNAAREAGFKRHDVQGIPLWELPAKTGEKDKSDGQ